MRYLMLMWPGFARAWFRGEIYGVALAMLYAACINIVWTATFLWPAWFSPWLTTFMWIGVIVASLVSLVLNLMRYQALFGESKSSTDRQQADVAFRSAQKAYLRGEYFEAEAALHPIFASGREDAESALLLAGILRRTNRVDQALQTLERLSRLESSAVWAHEIHRERGLCQLAKAPKPELVV